MECHPGECHSATCYSAKQHSSKCYSAEHYCAECHSAECHSTQCFGTLISRLYAGMSPRGMSRSFLGEKFELISTFSKTNFFITFSIVGATTFPQLAVLQCQRKNEKTVSNIAIRGTNYLLTLGP